MVVEFKLVGTEAMARRLRTLGRRFPDRIEAALEAEAELIRDKARGYAPEDAGDLRASGKVSRATKDAFGFYNVVISFGGPGVEYALAIHEHPSRHSPSSWVGIRDAGGRFRAVRFSPPGTGPKFLEKALNESARPGGLSARVAARLKL